MHQHARCPRRPERDRALQDCRPAPLLPRCGQQGLSLRQKKCQRGALPHDALDPEISARLLGEAVDLAQSEACSPADLLRGEKRLEYMIDLVRGNSRPRVGEREGEFVLIARFRGRARITTAPRLPPLRQRPTRGRGASKARTPSERVGKLRLTEGSEPFARLQAASLSSCLTSMACLIKRRVRSTKASLSARQLSRSMPTPRCPETSAIAISATYSAMWRCIR